MDKDSIAYRYAAALSEIDGVDLRQVEEELNSLVAAMVKENSIQVYFESPQIPSVDKKKKITAALSGKVSANVNNLLCLLIDKGRETHLSEVASALTAIVDEKFNRVRPYVYLGKDFSDDKKKGIAQEVETLIQKNRSEFGVAEKGDLEFITTISTDSEMLGGVILRVGDNMWDASVSRFLKDWRTRVLANPVSSAAME